MEKKTKETKLTTLIIILIFVLAFGWSIFYWYKTVRIIDTYRQPDTEEGATEAVGFIKDVNDRISMLEKDFKRLLNFKCLQVIHFTDGTGRVQSYPFQDAGICKEGYTE